jgi:hypothetical protein
MTPEEIAHLQRLAQAQQEQQREQFSQHLAAEQERLLDAIPQWRADPELATREMSEIRQHMIDKHNYTQNDLAVIPDHRAVLAMRELMLSQQRESEAKRRSAEEKTKRERQQKAEQDKAAEKTKRLEDAKKVVRKHSVSTHHGAQALADALDDE